MRLGNGPLRRSLGDALLAHLAELIGLSGCRLLSCLAGAWWIMDAPLGFGMAVVKAIRIDRFCTDYRYFCNDVYAVTIFRKASWDFGWLHLSGWQDKAISLYLFRSSAAEHPGLNFNRA